MKKIVITSFLAILLSLSFYFIAIWEPDSYIGDNVDKNLVLDENKNDKKETTDKASNEENIKDENKEENKEKNSDSSQSLNSGYKSSNNILNEEEKNTGMQENNTKDNNKESNDAVQSNASVFTVKKEEIIDKLSFKDKTKLLSLANKMSAVDVERIRESLEKSDEKEGAAEVFKVIKRRLTDEDYKQIKEILSPYINIKLLESMY